MNYDRPPASVPATPEYVLEVFRDAYRQQCRYDPEAEPGVDLKFESTVADWRAACDLLDWRPLGRGLDIEWGLGRPDEAWRSVLEPAKGRTLRDVCAFIASGAERPAIEPACILGAACLPAGAFLAIRSLLREEGGGRGHPHAIDAPGRARPPPPRRVPRPDLAPSAERAP